MRDEPNLASDKTPSHKIKEVLYLSTEQPTGGSQKALCTFKNEADTLLCLINVACRNIAPSSGFSQKATTITSMKPIIDYMIETISQEEYIMVIMSILSRFLILCMEQLCDISIRSLAVCSCYCPHLYYL